MATTDMIRFENVKKIYTGLDAKKQRTSWRSTT